MSEAEKPSDFVEKSEAKAFEKQLEQDPSKFLDAVSEQVAEAKKAAEQIAEQIHEGQVPAASKMEAFQEALNEAEAMRAQLGAPTHPAQEAFEEQVQESLAGELPNLLEAEEGMEAVEGAFSTGVVIDAHTRGVELPLRRWDEELEQEQLTVRTACPL